jgi:hypothetical protein
MEESSQGRMARQDKAGPGTTPSRRRFDRRRNSEPSIGASGQARSKHIAPSDATLRPFRAGYTPPPAADSDFDFPGFPPEQRGSPLDSYVGCRGQAISDFDEFWRLSISHRV